MATKKRWPDPRQNIRFEQKTGYPSNLHAASSKISYVHKKFMMVEKKGRATRCPMRQWLILLCHSSATAYFGIRGKLRGNAVRPL